jgi:hypothetical protein
MGKIANKVIKATFRVIANGAFFLKMDGVLC